MNDSDSEAHRVAVRLARLQDYPRLWAMGQKFHAQARIYDATPPDEESFFKTCDTARPTGLLFVAELAGKVVGMAAGIVSPLYFSHSTLIGTELFWWVDPEARGSGAAKRLKQALESRAKAMGVKYWSMAVLESLTPEKIGEIYKAAGYVPAERAYMKVLN